MDFFVSVNMNGGVDTTDFNHKPDLKAFFLIKQQPHISSSSFVYVGVEH